MKQHRTGELINGKYIVLGIMEGRAIIAKSIRYDATEPYVVWHLDSQGGTYSGMYTPDRRGAVREFVGRCRGYRGFPKAYAEQECKEAGLEVLSEQQFYEVLESLPQDTTTEFRPQAMEDGGDPMEQMVDWLMGELFGAERISDNSQRTA